MQIVGIFVGLGLYALVSLVNYKFCLGAPQYMYEFGIILLLMLCMTLVMWLNFRFFAIQPFEAAKIATLIMSVSILERSKIGTINDLFNFLAEVTAIFFVPILLIFLQPDLGSSLVFLPMAFALLYALKLYKRFFISVFTVFARLLGLLTIDIYCYVRFLEKREFSGKTNQYEEYAFLPLKDYRRNRILSVVVPDLIDPKGISTSWNLRQALITIGSDNLVGKVHGNGTQAKLGYLPHSVEPNAFIFSALGGLFVIVLCMVLVGNGMRIVGLEQDPFGMLVALGVSVILIVHIFINIGMTIGLMPITSLSLPFLSYGGSFILSCCVLQELVQSIDRFRQDLT